jgi:hypothetical protein
MTMLMDIIRNRQAKAIQEFAKEWNGKRGAMRWVDKHQLHVDPTYQRDKTETKIEDVARDWSWVAAGVITVADRSGKMFVVDGQHRVAAAMLRKDITDLPCIVFESAGVKWEAEGFLVTQTRRKPVTAVEKYRALVASGNAGAIQVRDLIASSGRAVEKWASPNTVHCLGVIMRMMLKEDSTYLKRIWPLVVELCKGKPMNEVIIRALAYIERRMPDKSSLTDKDWQKRVLKLGHDHICEAARRAAAYHGSATDSTWSIGVVEAINKGHRNRLELTK